MTTIGDWSQLGIAGTIAVALGTVIAYVFRLFTTVQQDAVKRALAERDIERAEVTRLHIQNEQQQKDILLTLADVSRVMAEVQQMMREREIQHAMEREFDRRGRQHGENSP